MTRSLAGWMGLALVVAAIGPAAVGPAAADDVTLTVTVGTQFGGTVSGAELTASWDGGSVTETTRSNGQALVDVPEGADVSIEVDHPDYVRNNPVEVENARSRSVDVTVAERGHATITVQSGDGPVEDASVRLVKDGRTGASVSTDADGVARSGPIEQGTYDLTVSKAGYHRDRMTLGVGEDTTRTVGIRHGSVQLTVVVEDDHFDPPERVENATVDIDPIGTTLVTLSDGEASTRVPINTNYDLTVSKPGYETTTRSVATSQGDASYTVSISRTPEVNLTADNRRVVVGESVEVHATDEYGDPIEDAALTVDGTEVARTDADGEATVPVETAGNVTITATADGAEDAVTVEGVGTGESGDVTTENGESSGGLGPGFGPVVAVLAVALGAGLLARRR